MPYRKEQFINGDIYHITSRAIDDNLIFKNTDDYYRGIFSIYEFNNANPVEIWKRRRDRIIKKKKEREEFSFGGLPMSPEATSALLIPDKRDRFVDILAFCFMPNHIHLLLRQIKDYCGISKFMQKVGIGYGKYFNEKYKRKGHVFQDTFKSVHIKNDEQLITVFNYIHANPISLIEPGWKETGIKDSQKVIKFLEEEYRWSSYFDYIGKSNFPSVTTRGFMSEVLRGEKGCREVIKEWVLYHKALYHKDLSKYNDLFLE